MIAALTESTITKTIAKREKRRISNFREGLSLCGIIAKTKRVLPHVSKRLSATCRAIKKLARPSARRLYQRFSLSFILRKPSGTLLFLLA
ncbi:MAG: hypothetical protein BWX44_01600 [Spirochaetes bacterium ADurb.Bin001]|nr:MAG: hypothetical protein BWX44_01600 [Spirochaetes bacterium ADurb.Bin001]